VCNQNGTVSTKQALQKFIEVSEKIKVRKVDELRSPAPRTFATVRYSKTVRNKHGHQ
jgi:hypothetical protein